MPRIKYPAPPSDQIEKNFMAALERLQSGTPTNKVLRAAKAKGILKINASTVAQEAGHSRTLIGMENCRYPRIRELIHLAKSNVADVPRTHTELIQKLRAEIADLRIQVKQFQAEATVHFIARKKAEATAERLHETNARLLKSQKSGNNIVTLAHERNT